MDSSQIEQIWVGNYKYASFNMTAEGFFVNTEISEDTLRIPVDSVVTRIYTMMKDTTLFIPIDKVTAIYGYKRTRSERLKRGPLRKLFIPTAIVTSGLLAGAAFYHYDDDTFSAVGITVLVAIPLGICVGMIWKSLDDLVYFDTGKGYRLVVLPKKSP
jgi:hypothetical protein